MAQKKINDFSERKIPTRQVINKAQFHQQEKRDCDKASRLELTADNRWKGSLKIIKKTDLIQSSKMKKTKKLCYWR